MRHLEIYVVESIADFDQLASLDVSVDDLESCSSCVEDVGTDFTGELTPFCAVIDDSDTWIVCIDCASNVI
jgi:hypothetical protein